MRCSAASGAATPARKRCGRTSSSGSSALIEGDRRDRIKLDAAPWTADKIVKRVAKHAAWLVIALLTGGAAMLYFVDAPTLMRGILHAPGAVRRLSVGRHPHLHHLFARRPHARAGLPLHVPLAAHPGRADRQRRAERHLSLRPRRAAHVGERTRRKRMRHGEPAGDCIDCLQCVAVCPTGVDIRKGSQLGCIQCGLCIDACDAVMTKIHRPTRLIAYDTDENRERRKRGERNVYRLVRARTILYAAVIALTGGDHALCAAHAHQLTPERPARARAAVYADGRGRRPQRLHPAFFEQAQRTERLHARGQRRSRARR